jgi:hypothetical protein
MNCRFGKAFSNISQLPGMPSGSRSLPGPKLGYNFVEGTNPFQYPIYGSLPFS